MQEFILSFMNQFGYSAIFILILLENIFPPIPSEVILGFGGFITTYSHLSILGVIISATLGSFLVALFLYGIGKIFNKEKLLELTSSKFGKAIHLKKKNVNKADKWFDTYGQWAVLGGRFIPIVRSLISIPAGMSDMPLPKFIFYTIIGSGIWNTVLILLGNSLGKHWKLIETIMKEYVFVLVILLCVTLFVIYYVRRNRKRKFK